MIFPKKIIFRFLDKATRRPLENIVVSVVLYARRKNNYYTIPKFTNKEGYVYFKKEDCLETIKVSKENFIMDYFSTLEECLPKISLEVFNEKSIKFTIDSFSRYDVFWRKYSIYKNKNNFLNSLVNSNNKFYKPIILDFKEDFLKKNKNIKVELEKVNI